MTFYPELIVPQLPHAFQNLLSFVTDPDAGSPTSYPMVAFVGVLLQGILRGVLLAAVVSLLRLVRRAARPHVAFLGRIPATRRYSDLERNPDNEVVPDALIFRVEAGLLYFNVEHVRQVVWQKLRAAAEPLRLVVCDLSTSPYVDVAGARMLAGWHKDLAAVGIECQLVEAYAAVRDRLRVFLSPRSRGCGTRSECCPVAALWYQA
jgi:sulfate permease, SulP family